MTDEELNLASFSRQEIIGGLQSIERIAKAGIEDHQTDGL